jgi:hypothetical protein
VTHPWPPQVTPSGLHFGGLIFTADYIAAEANCNRAVYQTRRLTAFGSHSPTSSTPYYATQFIQGLRWRWSSRASISERGSWRSRAGFPVVQGIVLCATASQVFRDISVRTKGRVQAARACDSELPIS